LLKKSRNRLLTRAAQNAECYRAVTVRERSAAAVFSSLMNASTRGISIHQFMPAVSGTN
jgi:hypothetical protein